MSTPSKPPPRFLPTLTEVVQAAPAVLANTQSSLEDTLDAVLSRLQEPLALEIRGRVTDLLQKRMIELQTTIEQEVMHQLRPWVEQAVKEAIDLQKP